MTGRIRTVKPEWLEDELLAAASDAARLLSVALLLIADDHGRGRASPATLATEAWRYEMERDDGANAPEVLAKASRAFRELIDMRYAVLYEVNGQRYFEIRNWKKHQRVDRPSAPRVPPPIAAESKPLAVVRERIAEASREPREPLATDPDLRSPIPITDPDQATERESAAWSIETFERARPGDLGRLGEHSRKAFSVAQVEAGGGTCSMDTGSRWIRFGQWLVENANAHQMTLAEVLERVVSGYVHDAWVRERGFPIEVVIGTNDGRKPGNPGKYFTARPLGPSRLELTERIAAHTATTDAFETELDAHLEAAQ